MRNVEGVRIIRKPEKHYALSLEQGHQIIKQAAIGVLSLRRAPKLGKTARVLRLIRSSCSLRSLPDRKGPCPIGVRFPRQHLYAQANNRQYISNM